MAAADPQPEASQLIQALTPRERQVLAAITGGSTNSQIAGHLGVSTRTVQSHVAAMLAKTGAHNRVQLAVLAVRSDAGPCRAGTEWRP